MTSRTLARLHTRFRQREAVGVLKYGTTMDRRDLRPVDWLNHLQEELMDACLYAERLRDALPLLHEARALMDGTDWDDEAAWALREDWCQRYDALFGDETREE